MQESQGDHLTGPEEGLRMFGDRAQLLIDLREQRRDKLDGGGHRRLRSSQGCTLATSVEEVEFISIKLSTATREDGPGMREGIAEVPHPGADAHLPEAAAVCDVATAFDPARDLVAP